MCCRGLCAFLASVAAAVTSSVVLLLQWVGLVQRPIVLLLGLDNAGKTTFRMLSADGEPSRRPTVIRRPHRESLYTATLGTVRVNLCEPGWFLRGHKALAEYCRTASGILLFVDATDRARLPQAAELLQALVRGTTVPRRVPILVLGNKIDLPDAVTQEELEAALALPRGLRDHQVAVTMCSIKLRAFHRDAITWFTNTIARRPDVKQPT